MASESEYDIIVVGAGLIGSAAARHLVEISNDVKVLLIGPEKPKVRVGSSRLFKDNINKNVGTIMHQNMYLPS